MVSTNRKNGWHLLTTYFSGAVEKSSSSSEGSRAPSWMYMYTEFNDQPNQIYFKINKIRIKMHILVSPWMPTAYPDYYKKRMCAFSLHYRCQTCWISLSRNQPLHLSVPMSAEKAEFITFPSTKIYSCMKPIMEVPKTQPKQ